MSYMMENEINSQSTIIENLIKKHIVNYCVMLDIPLDIKNITIVASGSSYNAGMYGKYFFESIANIPVSVEYAAEFAHKKFDNYSEDILYIFISQSGNSTDTVKAISRLSGNKNIKTLCITNNPDSELHKLATFKFDIEAGKESAIAATKTFSATVLMLWLLALKAAQNKKINVADETKDIYNIKNDIEASLSDIANIDLAVSCIAKAKDFSISGFGLNYPLALEAALKIKETCYINTSAYPIGEFIHGHYAVLNESKLLLLFMTSDASEYELRNLKTILSTYKVRSIIVSDAYEDYNCDILVKINGGQSKIAKILNMIICAQSLALKSALKLKHNVDSPIGLHKVVLDEETVQAR